MLYKESLHSPIQRNFLYFGIAIDMSDSRHQELEWKGFSCQCMLYLVLCVPSLTLSQSKLLLQASNLNFKFSILYQRVIELATNAVRASRGPAVVTLNVKNPLGMSSVGEMERG